MRLKEKPYFSVIIPTLNEAICLPNLLRDLSNQTFNDFQVIVVDAESEDETKKIAISYSKKIPGFKIINSNKRNVSYQRNLGAKNSDGEYLVFIDADSRIPENLLEVYSQKLKDGDTEVFSSWFVSTNKRSIFMFYSYMVSLGYWVLYKLGFPASPGCLLGLKKEVFLDSKGFSEQIQFAEDRDLVRRLNSAGHIFKFYFYPKYGMSLRRIERMGILKYLCLFILVNIKRELGIKVDRKREYPMGGKI